MGKKETYDFSGLSKPADSTAMEIEYDFSGLKKKDGPPQVSSKTATPEEPPPSGFRTVAEKGQQIGRPRGEVTSFSLGEEETKMADIPDEITNKYIGAPWADFPRDKQSVFIDVERHYKDKGEPSPYAKIDEYKAKEVLISSSLSAGEITNEEAVQQSRDLADKLGLMIQEDGSLSVSKNELDKYDDLLGRYSRKKMDDLAAREQDGFVKDVLDALNVGSARVLSLPVNIAAFSETVTGKVLNLANLQKDGSPTYWTEKADLERDWVASMRESNQRYDKSIVEALANGDFKTAFGQSILQTAENIPQVIPIILGSQIGLIKPMLHYMSGDKAIEKYLVNDKQMGMGEFTKGVNALGAYMTEFVFETMGTAKILETTKLAMSQLGAPTVRDAVLGSFTPVLQRQLAIFDKGISAGVREAATEGATELTDNIMDKAIGYDVNIGDGVIESMIVGFNIGAGMVSPQMIKETVGGNNAYTKRVRSAVPPDIDFDTKVELIDLLIKSDEIAYKIKTGPEATKESLKEELEGVKAEVSKLLHTPLKEKAEAVLKRPVEAPKKPVETRSTPSEGKVPLEGESVSDQRIERPDTDLRVEEAADGKFTVKQEGTNIAPEFNTREEAEAFKENFDILTQGERTFEEQKKITEEKKSTLKKEKTNEVIEPLEFDKEGDLTDRSFASLESGLRDIISDVANRTGVTEEILREHFDITNRGEYFSSLKPILEAGKSINFNQLFEAMKKAAKKEGIPIEKVLDYKNELMNALERGESPEVPKMMQDLFSAIEEIGDRFQESIKERTKAEEAPETKEIIEKNRANNSLVLQIQQYNKILRTSNVKRSVAIQPINRLAQQLGYSLTTKNGKVIALNERGTKIQTINEKGEYTSISEIAEPELRGFVEDFLEYSAMKTDLDVPVYGKDLQKAAQDLLGGIKNQNSDIVLRGIQEMYESGYIQVRSGKGSPSVSISIADIKSLLAEPKLNTFIEKYGFLDATNVDKALEEGVVTQKEYDIVKKQLENEIKQRDQAGPEGAEDRSGVTDSESKGGAKAEEVREIPMAVEEGAEAEMGEKPSSIEQAMRNRPEDAPVPEAETMPKDMKGTWLDRYFKARGIIPKPVFRSYVKSKGANTASMYEIERVQREFKRNLKKEYGKTALGRPKVEPETMAKMNDALSNMGEGGTGWETLKELPVSIQESLIEMRANVDALSREMVRAGIVEGDLVAKFEENMGFYLTRTYRAHNDKKWTAKKIPEEVRNRAINFLRSEYPEFTEKQIDARLNAWLLEQDGPIGYIKNGPMGSKDLSILKGRKDIPIELRDFLGEYNDPLYNYASSVYRMTDLIAKDRFLKETLEIGDGKFLFDEPMGEFVKQIAAEGSKAMSPLNGKYTTPELAKAFENFENPRHFSSWFGQGYMAINSAVKYGKTILSPQTHIRNYVSNYMFHVANGRIFSGKGKGKDLFRFDYKNNKDPKYQEHISRLIELGVLKDNARAGEIFDSIRDSYKDFNDLDKSTDTFFKKPLKKTGKAFTELYQIEDDVHKLYSFGVEYNRYEGVMRKKFPEASEAEIKTMTEEKAADVVRNTMPTYSLVPEAMKQIRKLPIMGTFISFPAEVIRTTWNVMELATMEMKDPHTRQIGIGRMTGLLTAAVATSAASYGSKFLVGMNNSDDDDLRRFMPSWSENSDLVFVKQPKDGKYTYIDLGYSDPFNYIKKGVNAYLNNQENPGEGINSMVTEMLEPFIGEELLASKILDVQRNSKKETGTQIYNPTDTWGGQAAEKLLYMWDGVKPGIISSADRIAKGAKKKVEGSREYDLAEEVVAVGLGQRVAKINVGESFMFKTKGYASDISDAKFLYNKVRYSKSPDINEKQLGKAYDNANASLEKIIMEAHEDYKAALRLGVSKRELKTHIINNMGGSGKMAQGMIVKGRFVPINRKTGGW